MDRALLAPRAFRGCVLINRPRTYDDLPHAVEFGEERLIEALQVYRNLSPDDRVAAIFDEVRRFSPHEQRDDFTLIVGRCKDGDSW